VSHLYKFIVTSETKTTFANIMKLLNCFKHNKISISTNNYNIVDECIKY